MIHSDTPGRRRLFRLLDRIIVEERDFKRNSQLTQKLHPRQAGAETITFSTKNIAGELEHVRLAHEAMLKIHRRFINDHELIIQRCMAISRQTRAGLLSEDEMAMEVERLQRELRRMKREHSQVEKECRRLLNAQKSFFGDSKDGH
ncbi:MAG: hypothetical protein JSU74_01495 [Candidatus Zixiibacteriota bacterium]|nr:MAG: hypothetical protein JSU74_01495 [candidate division Zixibacteria bacterium]